MNLSEEIEHFLNTPALWRNTYYDTEEVDSKINNLVANQIEITPENISKAIGRSWKSTLKKMIPFLERINNQFPFNWQQEWAPIPQANYADKLNVSHQTIGIWINNLKKLYILESIGTHNFIGQSTMLECETGHSQDYLCNKPQLKELLKYAKSDYSNAYSTHDKKNIPNIDTIGNSNINKDIEIYNNNIDTDINNENIPNFDTIGNNNINKILLDYVNNNLKNDNLNLPPLEQYHFMNGNRRYSDICSLKSLEKAIKTGKIDQNDTKQVSEFYETSREKYLDSVFGKDKWKEYDRTASVPTITYLFNKGEWKSNNYDFYGEFAKALLGDNYSEQDRKDIKKLFMLCYFSNLRGMWQIFKQATEALLRGGKYAHYEHVEMLAAMVRLSDGIDEEVTFENVGEIWKKYLSPRMNDLNQKIIDILGEGLGPDIFILESAIYAEVKRNIPERNVQVYDAFYLSKDSKIDMDSIMENAAYKIIQNVLHLERQNTQLNSHNL